MERVQERLQFALMGAGMRVGLLTTAKSSASAYPGVSESWGIQGTREGKYSIAWWRGTSDSDGEWWRWRPDLVIGIGDAAIGVLATRPRCPVVTQAHGTVVSELASSVDALSLREALKLPLHLARLPSRVLGARLADEIWSISEAIASQLRRAPYRVTKPIRVIPNGVETDVFRFDPEDRRVLRARLGIESSSSVGLYAGRLHRQKGVDLAIGAAAVLGRDSHLLVAGAGEEEPRLRALVERLGVESRVHFLGLLEPAALAQVMAAADLLVFPTRRREGLPLVLLEAAATGLPAMVSAGAATPRALEGRVAITRTVIADVAATWAAARQVDDRSSYLPEAYGDEAVCQSYASAAWELIRV